MACKQTGRELYLKIRSIKPSEAATRRRVEPTCSNCKIQDDCSINFNHLFEEGETTTLRLPRYGRTETP